MIITNSGYNATYYYNASEYVKIYSENLENSLGKFILNKSLSQTRVIKK